MTWTRCSDRWPPADTSNIAVLVNGTDRAEIASTGFGANWLWRNGVTLIDPDDLYLILPAVPEEGKK